MGITTKDILDAALSLSEADRILLATQLLDSVSDCQDLLCDDNPGFYDELDRRSADLTGAVRYEELWMSIDMSYDLSPS